MNKRKALLERSNAMRSILKALRKKKASNPPFLNEDGAIDTSSIMIAVIVLGLLAGLIASTVFVVIPWAQDEAAKNQLKSVMAAQQAYAGMATLEEAAGPIGSIYALKLQRYNTVVMSNSQTGKYGDLTDLIESSLFDPSFMPVDGSDEIYGEQVLSPDNSICIIKLEAGKGYEAAVRSTSGNIFVTNDGWVGPIRFPDTSPVCRGRVLGDYSDYEDKIANPQPTPSATPTSTETPYTTPEDHEEGEVAGEDEVVAMPTPTPTVTPTGNPDPTPTPTATATVTPAPTSTPVAPKPEPIPDIPAENKDSKTKKFMFCHMGAMHSNNFNGMVNGHHGHTEDIMPPIPFKNYAGWNWNAQTAKIYYNNCKPL